MLLLSVVYICITTWSRPAAVIALDAPPSSAWSYSRNDTPLSHPEKWASEYPQCGGTEKLQSPIAIKTEYTVDEGDTGLTLFVPFTTPLSQTLFFNHTTDVQLGDDGNTLLLDMRPRQILLSGSAVEDKMQLQQIHFHAGGEHSIDGHKPRVEMHMKFTNTPNPTKNLTVMIAVFIDPGSESNTFIKPLTDRISYVPKPGTHAKVPDFEFTYDTHLKRYFTYRGSLTTPPCSGDVQWFVQIEHWTASHQQLNALINVMVRPQGGMDNSRPIQANTIPVASVRALSCAHPDVHPYLCGVRNHTDAVPCQFNSMVTCISSALIGHECYQYNLWATCAMLDRCYDYSNVFCTHNGIQGDAYCSKEMCGMITSRSKCDGAGFRTCYLSVLPTLRSRNITDRCAKYQRFVWCAEKYGCTELKQHACAEQTGLCQYFGCNSFELPQPEVPRKDGSTVTPPTAVASDFEVVESVLTGNGVPANNRLGMAFFTVIGQGDGDAENPDGNAGGQKGPDSGLIIACLLTGLIMAVVLGVGAVSIWENLQGRGQQPSGGANDFGSEPSVASHDIGVVSAPTLHRHEDYPLAPGSSEITEPSRRSFESETQTHSPRCSDELQPTMRTSAQKTDPTY